MKLKTLVPDTKIVFVTLYDDYAMEAFRVHADGYLLKPVDPAQIREEIDNNLPYVAVNDKLQVHCFGYFEIYWDSEPLSFSRKQSKELFAFLVDRRGASCTSEEIIAALWEHTGIVVSTQLD